ncbi:c-type cytochrome [Salegentibacter chungangensis]|uniref:C-type cytochrome n=1 Tax=Salegentibacter chungangensis TaxID=1335724 RepID=A0ABW3NRM2_9FLAO
MKKLLSLVLLVIIIGCKSDKKERKAEEKPAPVTQQEVQSPQEKSIAEGKKIYSKLCAACHLPGGKGIPGTYPPLAGSDWLTEKRKESIRAVKYGLEGDIVVNGKKYNNLMTPMGLDDQQVADVMNYVMSSWGNELTDMVTPQEVANIKEKE